ncbi:MAG: ThuA domain-containing protein [Limisphaerales bacterium]
MPKLILCLLTAATLLDLSALAADKKVVLIAGKPSHGPGEHEFRAGCLLLQKCLGAVPGLTVEVCTNGWPKDDSDLDGAAAVVLYADGGPGHPFFQAGHARVIEKLARQGVGLGFMHYAVEVPKGPAAQAMWEWIGGYYEDHYSCNPMWAPDYRVFPNHPITRGVRPFSVKDEWYMNMRWRPDTNGLVNILVAKPSDAVRDGPYVWPAGPYPHIQAAKGREEAMMWACERADGGRGFGWTGGHYFKNWGDDNHRKVVLNAILWLAKIEVPPDGVESSVTADDLTRNLDNKGRPQ